MEPENDQEGSSNVELGFVNGLLLALRDLTAKVTDPAYAIIAIIGILGLLALGVVVYSVSGIEFLWGYLAFLVFLTFAILLIIAMRSDYIVLGRKSRLDGGTTVYESERSQRITILRDCLERLTDNDFADLQVTMLSVRERENLRQPVTKAQFLGDIEQMQMLDMLEALLRQKWGSRCHDLFTS